MEHRPDRICERVDRERLAADGRSLQDRQAGERAVEPVCPRVDDRVTVERELNERVVGPTSRISNDLDHAATLAPHPAVARPAVNLDLPGGCLAGFGIPPRRTQAPSAVVLVVRWN